MDDVIDAVVNYVKEDRERLESRVVRPCLDYLGDRLSWNLRLFWVLAALVVMQTVMLAHLIRRI
jgi:hypothetical protein